jgi:hypothetical protein
MVDQPEPKPRSIDAIRSSWAIAQASGSGLSLSGTKLSGAQLQAQFLDLPG